MRRLLTILLVLLLSLVPAMALREDFLVSSQVSTINVCACSFTKVPLRLANTGDVTSVYEVSTSGDAAPWAALTKQGMTLEPNDAAETTMFVRAPCDAKGSFDLRTHVKTIFDTEAALGQRVQVNPCSNLYLVPTAPTSQRTCPCTPAKYSFMLKNDGDHAETYTVSVEPEDYVSIGSPRLTIASGKQEPVVIFINKPCDVFGEFDHTLRVVATHAGWTNEIPLGLTVDACYGYNVLVAPSISMCKAQGKTSRIPLTIQNTAAIMNTYDIKTKIGGTTTTYDPLMLRGGEQQVITLSVDLADVPAGENDLTVTTSSRRGAMRLDKTVSFNALVCEDGGVGKDAPNGTRGTQNMWLIVLLISILLAVLIGILIKSRKPRSDDDPCVDLGAYDESSTRVTKKTKEKTKDGFAKREKAVPADLPGWFTPLLIIFIALGVLALLLGAFFVVDASVTGGEGTTEGTTYVDSLDIFAVEPQTTMPDRAADAGLAEDLTQGVPIIEQGWFIGGLMAIVFLVIVLLVLTIKLKTRADGDGKGGDEGGSADSMEQPDELVSVASEGKAKGKDKPQAAKARQLDIGKDARKTKALPAASGAPASLVYLGALLVLLLLSGAAFALYYSPLIFEGFGEERLHVDAEGLETHRGAIIVRIGETIGIPLTFKNLDAGDAHIDLDVPVGWITFTQATLDIGAFDEAAVTMAVSPDETVKTGRYRMEFTITAADAAYQEDAVLYVLAPGEEPHSIWSWVSMAALAVIIVLAVLLAYRRGRKWERTGERTERIEKKTEKKKYDALKSGIEDTGASFLKTKRLKRKKLVIFGLGLLLMLLICAGAVGILWRYTTIFGDHRPSPGQDDRTLSEILLSTTPGIHESHVIVGDERTIIPMRITNVHDDRDYKINVYEDIPWLSVDSDQHWIPPGESVVIPLVVDKDRGVANGAYRISVDIRTSDDLDSIFTNDIVIVVNHSRRTYLAMLYLPYILLGTLLVIYLFSTKRKLKRWRRSRLGDDDMPGVKTNGKTNIRLK